MLLVTDCERDVLDRELRHVVDLGDVAVTLDGDADTGLGEVVRTVRNRALTALALAAFEGVTHDGRSLGSADIVYDPGQRPVYVVIPTGSVTVRSEAALLPEQAATAVALASALAKAPKGLRHVPRLLAQSREARLQPLGSFISAWAGLEMLVVGTSAQYEASLSDAMAGALPGSIVKRMREVMKDKYRLADKFAIMSSVLDPVNAEPDLDAVLRLKEARDAFFHTLSLGPDSLPGDATRRLLRKYLTLHLQPA